MSAAGPGCGALRRARGVRRAAAAPLRAQPAPSRGNARRVSSAEAPLPVRYGGCSQCAASERCPVEAKHASANLLFLLFGFPSSDSSQVFQPYVLRTRRNSTTVTSRHSMVRNPRHVLFTPTEEGVGWRDEEMKLNSICICTEHHERFPV